MTGYDHIYKSFLPHDDKKYPLVKMISDELNIVNESGYIQVISLPAFTIYNHLFDTVSIYKLDASRNATYFDDIPAKSKSISMIPDFKGQWWVARTPKDRDSSVLGYYVVYPGCTTWDIASFPTHRFFPSAWNSTSTQPDQPWNVCITNKLKTYVCIWQVMPNGSLKFVRVLNSCFSTHSGPCYIGTSLVATQGNTVISTFFADSTECTTWSLDILTHLLVVRRSMLLVTTTTSSIKSIHHRMTW